MTNKLRDALGDEQAYGIAAKVMKSWPVPTIAMYVALVRAGYRAALAAPSAPREVTCPNCGLPHEVEP